MHVHDTTYALDPSTGNTNKPIHLQASFLFKWRHSILRKKPKRLSVHMCSAYICETALGLPVEGYLFASTNSARTLPSLRVFPLTLQQNEPVGWKDLVYTSKWSAHIDTYLNTSGMPHWLKTDKQPPMCV